jgi:tetratricopeptide (TPR) repeat protein
MKMKKTLLLLFLCAALPLSAQTYKDIAGKAIDCVNKDSLTQAVKLFNQAIALEPNNKQNALLYCNLGLVQRKLGNFGEAADAYTAALKIEPSSCPIMLRRAAVYMDQNIESSALADYNQVLLLEPDNKEALLLRAYINAQRGDFAAARADYNHLMVKEPTNYDARLGLALLEQKAKDFRKSMEMLNTLINENPNNATLYLARANVEMDITQPDLALLDVDRSITLDPKSPDAFVLRGDIYLRMKKKTEARENYLRALKAGARAGELKVRIQKCQ